MKHNRRKYINDGRLEAQKSSFLSYLLDLGYAEISLQYYQQVMNCLEQYMYDNGIAEASARTNEEFLKNENKLLCSKPNILKRFKLVVRRYDTFLSGEGYSFRPTTLDRTCPKQFSSLFEGYLKALEKQCFRKRTIERHRDNLVKILQRFDEAQIGLSSDFAPADIYNAFEEATDKHGFKAALAGFLRYLYEIKHFDTDMSIYVPSKQTAISVPSVYTEEEIQRFLLSFDRQSKSGIRDYAASLLALRLGMRSSDISNLKIQDIDFGTNTINFTAGKTQASQRLELLPEVKEAICEYLKFVRPTSGFGYVFLTMNAPFTKISIQRIRSIVSEHLILAGIEIGQRKQGSHSLRMTLASELVSENVPYDVVRKILGHENPDATKHYVRFDIEKLREHAIRVPPIGGS